MRTVVIMRATIPVEGGRRKRVQMQSKLICGLYSMYFLAVEL